VRAHRHGSWGCWVVAPGAPLKRLSWKHRVATLCSCCRTNVSCWQRRWKSRSEDKCMYDHASEFHRSCKQRLPMIPGCLFDKHKHPVQRKRKRVIGNRIDMLVASGKPAPRQSPIFHCGLANNGQRGGTRPPRISLAAKGLFPSMTEMAKDRPKWRKMLKSIRIRRYFVL
jgi:hypothetical protein